MGALIKRTPENIARYMDIYGSTNKEDTPENTACMHKHYETHPLPNGPHLS